MTKATIEATLTRSYLANRPKDDAIEHVMRLLKENDEQARLILCYKGNTESVRRVCEKAGYATTFGPEGVHVIGGKGMPRDLADPVVEMACDVKRFRDKAVSLQLEVDQWRENHKKWLEIIESDPA